MLQHTVFLDLSKNAGRSNTVADFILKKRFWLFYLFFVKFRLCFSRLITYIFTSFIYHKKALCMKYLILILLHLYKQSWRNFWKSKTWVMTYELKVAAWKLKVRIKDYKCKLKSKNHNLKSKVRELEFINTS